MRNAALTRAQEMETPRANNDPVEHSVYTGATLAFLSVTLLLCARYDERQLFPAAARLAAAFLSRKNALLEIGDPGVHAPRENGSVPPPHTARETKA